MNCMTSRGKLNIKKCGISLELNVFFTYNVPEGGMIDDYQIRN